MRRRDFRADLRSRSFRRGSVGDRRRFGRGGASAPGQTRQRPSFRLSLRLLFPRVFPALAFFRYGLVALVGLRTDGTHQDVSTSGDVRINVGGGMLGRRLVDDDDAVRYFRFLRNTTRLCVLDLYGGPMVQGAGEQRSRHGSICHSIAFILRFNAIQFHSMTSSGMAPGINSGAHSIH